MDHVKNSSCFISSIHVLSRHRPSFIEQRQCHGNTYTAPLRRAIRTGQIRRRCPSGPESYVCALPALHTISTSVLTVVDPKVLNTSLSAISNLLLTLALGTGAASRGLLDPSTLTVSSVLV